jgi:hypothetical protein
VRSIWMMAGPLALVGCAQTPPQEAQDEKAGGLHRLRKDRTHRVTPEDACLLDRRPEGTGRPGRAVGQRRDGAHASALSCREPSRTLGGDATSRERAGAKVWADFQPVAMTRSLSGAACCVSPGAGGATAPAYSQAYSIAVRRHHERHRLQRRASTWPQRWQRFSAAAVRAFHAYANWLVSISWRRFIVLSLLLLIVMAILHDLPPFTWTVTEHTEGHGAHHQAAAQGTPAAPAPAVPPSPARPAPRRPPGGKAPGVTHRHPQGHQGRRATGEGVDISIGKDGVRITPPPTSRRQRRVAGPGASAAAHGDAPGRRSRGLGAPGLSIQLPPGATPTPCAKPWPRPGRAWNDAVREARQEAEQAARDAEQARATPSRPSRTGSPTTCAGPASAPRASASATS